MPLRSTSFFLYLIKGILRASKSCKTIMGSMGLHGPKPTLLPLLKYWIKKETKGRCCKENLTAFNIWIHWHIQECNLKHIILWVEFSSVSSLKELNQFVRLSECLNSHLCVCVFTFQCFPFFFIFVLAAIVDFSSVNSVYQ